MLEVVEQSKQGAVADLFGETAPRAERPCDRLDDEPRLAQAGEPNPEDSVRVITDHVAGSLERKARLPRAAGAGQGSEATPAVTQKRGDLGELSFATDERRCRHRQVRIVERLERREFGSADLEQPHGLVEVF